MREESPKKNQHFMHQGSQSVTFKHLILWFPFPQTEQAKT